CPLRGGRGSRRAVNHGEQRLGGSLALPKSRLMGPSLTPCHRASSASRVGLVADRQDRETPSLQTRVDFADHYGNTAFRVRNREERMTPIFSIPKATWDGTFSPALQ